MTTYQQILIILDNFEIIFIGALFGPGTAVTGRQKILGILCYTKLTTDNCSLMVETGNEQFV